jgi:murein DD-endopeptidase MepM/ murein hydrolase activator NlpD
MYCVQRLRTAFGFAYVRKSVLARSLIALFTVLATTNLVQPAAATPLAPSDGTADLPRVGEPLSASAVGGLAQYVAPFDQSPNGQGWPITQTGGYTDTPNHNDLTTQDHWCPADAPQKDPTSVLGINCGALDIGVPALTPIYPVADGKVVYAGLDGSGFGWHVIMSHPAYNTYSLYAHLNNLTVSTGATITRGTQIGLSGSSGNTGNPPAAHLHFGMTVQTANGFQPIDLHHFPGVTFRDPTNDTCILTNGSWDCGRFAGRTACYAADFSDDSVASGDDVYFAAVLSTCGGSSTPGPTPTPVSSRSPPSSNLPCNIGSEGVILYGQPNFGTGAGCWTVTGDSPDLSTIGAGDSVSSVAVRGPYRATLYLDPNYSGPNVAVTYQAQNLEQTSFGRGASSIRVQHLSACDPTTPGVTLYTQPNYGGVCQTFTSDVADLGSTTVFGDNTWSIRVNGPYLPTLFVDPNFSGTSQTFDGSTADLSTKPIGVGSSSLRIQSLPCSPSGDGVTVFSQPNFQGACATLTSDSADLSSVHLADAVSSVRVIGPYKATLYIDPNFQGNSTSVFWQSTNLDATSFGRGTSSIRVERIPCDQNAIGVTVFTQASFGGVCHTFTNDDSNLPGDLQDFNDNVYSVHMSPGYSATLYSDPGFNGSSVVVAADNSDLRGSAIGTGLSAIRVAAPVPTCNVTQLSAIPSANTVQVRASGSCNVGVRAVRLTANGSIFYELGSASVSATWTAPGPGAYAIQAQIAGLGDNDWTHAAVQTASVTVSAPPIATATPAPSSTPTPLPTTPSPTRTATPTLTPTPTPARAGAGALVFDDFSSGLASWNVLGSASEVTQGSNSFLRLQPPAGGAAEASRATNLVLAPYGSVQLRVNTNGASLLGNDASALYLDQGGWKYVALADYMTSGSSVWQTVSIPLSAFTGLDPASPVDSVGFRMWQSDSGVQVDIDDIQFVPLAPSGTSPQAVTLEDFSSVAANWSANGNVGPVSASGNTFLRLQPPDNGSVETWHDATGLSLNPFTAIELQINLNGAVLLDGDASAFYLDQGGWRYVSLSRYVAQGSSQWQTVHIPMADFVGFDRTSAFSRLGFRFWMPATAVIDVDNIGLIP